MNRITSQTSLQAAQVIHGASQFEDVQITVSWSGDVREANVLERVIYGVVDFFDAGAPVRRRNEAREAVKAKLTNEISFLVGPSSGVGPAVSPIEMTEAINQVAGQLVDGGSFSKIGIPMALCDALKNIQEITAETDKKSRKLIWKAVAEQRNENEKVSIDAAKNISQNTKIWKESLNISTRDAFRLASNAWKLYESKKILPEEGKEILLCSRRLISLHGFNHKDALNYAIDLRAPLKTLRFGMDSVERAMKTLDDRIAELREQPERLRISAAVRYLQLQDTDKYKDVQPIDEIRLSLHDLPRLQQAMPKGCVIDQIHQGAHVRGLSMHSFPEPSPETGDKKKSLTAPGQALTSDANRLMLNATPQGNTSKPVHEVHLPEIFSEFCSDHVKDLVRGNRFELLTDKKVDTEFSQIEEKRRENPKKLTTEEYAEWATKRVRWAGSERAVQIISNLESQPLFAEVAKFSLPQFSNKDKYKVLASGENNLAQTSFQANRLTGKNSIDEFILRETHYANATRLWTEPIESDSFDSETQKPAQIHIPLIPNPGPKIKASANGFSVKLSVGLSLTVPKNSEIQPTCRITEVSEEWDLMVDWDEWMSMRS